MYVVFEYSCFSINQSIVVGFRHYSPGEIAARFNCILYNIIYICVYAMHINSLMPGIFMLDTNNNVMEIALKSITIIKIIQY